MDINDMIDEYAKEEMESLRISGTEPQEVGETTEPVDVYQQGVDKRADTFKKPVQRGASTLTKEIAEEELEKLAKLKKRAEVDAEYWSARGDKERAQMVKDQYIEDHFLPSLELVIVASTPDEVLNAKSILSRFDELSMQYGPGYTASYIRTAYGNQLGSSESRSDGYIQNMVSRIKTLSSSDQIRSAYGLAKKVKDEVDDGLHTASEDDYEIITRVASIM